MRCVTILIISMTVIIFFFVLDYYTRFNWRRLWSPESFKIQDENTPHNGKHIAKQNTIVITALVRNNESSFNFTKKAIELIGSVFKEYKVILFENDSDDDTRNLLNTWAKENPHVTLLDCCALGNCSCILSRQPNYHIGVLSEERQTRMQNYRNLILEHVRINFSHFNLLLVCDFDLNAIPSMKGLYDILESPTPWDAVFCNGRTSIPGTFGAIALCYDGLAYVPLKRRLSSDKPAKLFKIMHQILNMNLDLASSKNNLLEVVSAFNGYGIYKMPSILPHSYDGEHYCEHINIHKKMHNAGARLFISKTWKANIDLQGPSLHQFLK
jgi:hypothetical protein